MLGMSDTALISHNFDLGPAIVCRSTLLCIIRPCRACSTSQVSAHMCPPANSNETVATIFPSLLCNSLHV